MLAGGGSIAPVDTAARQDLIAAAAAVLRPHRNGERLFDDVASVVVTDTGHRFTGVCIDVACGMGFCAEHAAIAAMVTAGHYRIAAVVAVWRDEGQRLYVLPPCGGCREFITQIEAANIDAEVVLGPDLSRPLRELLPHHDWPKPVEQGAATTRG